MVGKWGLLSGVATAAFVDPALCSIEDDGGDDYFGGGGDGGGDGGEGGGGDGGEGGAAALAADETGGGGGDGGDAGADEEDATGLEIPDTFKTTLSAERGEGEKLSNQEWAAKRGYKTLDDLVKAARGGEKALRDGGRVKIPGEGASEAEVKAFRERMGVPEEAAGYAIELPKIEGIEGKYEIDTAFLDPMLAIAHKHHISKAAMQDLASAFFGDQADQAKADAFANDQQRDAKIKEWGPQADAKKEAFRTGQRVLGLTKADINQLQVGPGAGKMMDMLVKIGELAGEDFFEGGGASPKFGVTTLDEAQRQLDALVNDPDKAKLLRAKDAKVKGEYDRLVQAVAHFRGRQKS